MPYKFTEGRRHKFSNARYRVMNWPEYDAALVRRGNLTVWCTDVAAAAWHAPATKERAANRIYSTIAIETGLALCLVFHQPLRQTKGLLRSIADVLGVDIAIPDHTALVQTPILSALWNDIGQRIQRAANLRIRIEAQFAPEPDLTISPVHTLRLLKRHDPPDLWTVRGDSIARHAGAHATTAAARGSARAAERFAAVRRST
jgi:hypothetical protein